MLFRGTVTVSLLTILSRIFGFARDILTANILGAGVFASAFFIAQRIPNLLRSIMAEGAFTSAFVPTFSDALAQGQTAALKTFREILGFALLLGGILSILGIVFSPELVSLFAPGFARGSQEFTLTVWLTQLMFPFLLCMTLVTLCNGALNAYKIFGKAALAQVVINCVLILAAFCAYGMEQHRAVEILSLSMVLGGICGVLIQLKPLKKCGLIFIPALPFKSTAVLQVIKLIAPATIGASIYQLGIFLNTAFASLLSDGAVAWLYYADRLAQLPIGVFTIALGSVLLPTLTSALSNNNHKAFEQNLSQAMGITSYVIGSISCALYFFADTLIQIAFVHGSFTQSDAKDTATVVRMLSLGLWGTSCYSIAVRALIAKKDTITPTLLGLFALFCTVLLSLSFMGAPQESTGIMSSFISKFQLMLPSLVTFDFGASGLALATSISQTLILFLALGILKAKQVSLPLSALAKSITLTLCISLGCNAILSTCSEQLFLINRTAGTLVLGILWPVIFFSASLILKVPEALQVKEKVATLLQKRK